MKNIRKISYNQTMLMVFLGTAGNLVYIHTEAGAIAGRSGWICTIVATLVVIMLCIFMVRVGSRFQGKSILTIIEDSFGRVVSCIVSIFYIVLMILLSATNLSLFAGVVNAYILILTPKWVPIFLLLVVCALIAGSGIEVLARMSIIFSLITIVNYNAANILAVVTTFDYKLLLPQFERPFITYIQGMYLILSSMLETFLFAAIGIENMPMNPRPYKAVAKGLLISSFFVVTVPTSFIGILGLTEATRTGYVAFNMFHGIQIGRFIQGMEVFVMITYYVIAVAKISINLFILKTALSHIIGKSHGRLAIVCTTVLVFVFFLKYISFNKAYLFAIQLAEYVTLPFVIFLSLIAAICLAVGKRKELKGKT